MEKIAAQYENLWNFPNCIGSMDEKHTLIRQMKNSGSYNFNYKGTFSLVLLALVDADYKFIYVDVRCNGRISDGECMNILPCQELSVKTF